jgi:thiamine biosynthesis lipoprotein
MAGLACRPGPRTVEAVFTGETQGTTYAINVVAEWMSPEQKSAVQLAINARLDDIDRTMSTYRADSDLSRFNALADTTPFKASPELVEVFQTAEEVSAACAGAFDVTVGPLVDAWGFGPDKTTRAAPFTDEAPAALRARVGYQKVVIDADASTLRKTQPDVRCTLNAIAQGYTCDKLGADLERLGCTDYLVEVGGEIKARGRNARGVPWQIGIEKPTAAGRAVDRVVSLENQTLATSGNYRNYYEKDGVRMTHIIDPATGRPIAHTLASVSVIHGASCAHADAYATALMVLGPDKGYELALKQGLAALFIVHEAGDAFSEKATPRFLEMISQ